MSECDKKVLLRNAVRRFVSLRDLKKSEAEFYRIKNSGERKNWKNRISRCLFHLSAQLGAGEFSRIKEDRSVVDAQNKAKIILEDIAFRDLLCGRVGSLDLTTLGVDKTIVSYVFEALTDESMTEYFPFEIDADIIAVVSLQLSLLDLGCYCEEN